MEQVFRGTITDVDELKSNGDWSAISFEVTESDPSNPEYPQVAKFDYFKNGEHKKYADSFENDFPIGTHVEVHYNFKANDWTDKEGNERKFYKVSAWKVMKLQEEPASAGDDEGDLPF